MVGRQAPVDPASIPTVWNTKTTSYRNCGEVELKRPMRLQVETQEGAEVITTQGLQDVQTSSTTLSVAIPKVGGSFGNNNSAQITFSSSTTKRDNKIRTITLTEEFTEHAAPRTLTIYRYGDYQSFARIPLSGKVVVDGDIVLKGYIPGTKTGGPPATPHKSLSEWPTAARTFDVKGQVSVHGTDRKVHIEVLTRPLDPQSETDCPSPDQFAPKAR